MEHAHNIAEQSRNLPLCRIWLQLSIWHIQRERERERDEKRDTSCDCGASYQMKLENRNSAKFYSNQEKANSLLSIRTKTNISCFRRKQLEALSHSVDANDFAQLVLLFCSIKVIRTDRQTDRQTCLGSLWSLFLPASAQPMCAERGEQKPKH